jgi:hypothetical protein
MAVQLGTGGPVERWVGLPTWTGGPVTSALAIGIEVIVVDKVAIMIPTIAANTTTELYLSICFCISMENIVNKRYCGTSTPRPSYVQSYGETLAIL